MSNDGEERDLALPPHDEEAERAVLGSILKNPRAIFEVAELLSPASFYSQRNADFHGEHDRLIQVDIHGDTRDIPHALRIAAAARAVDGWKRPTDLADRTQRVQSAAACFEHSLHSFAHERSTRGVWFKRRSRRFSVTAWPRAVFDA